MADHRRWPITAAASAPSTTRASAPTRNPPVPQMPPPPQSPRRVTAVLTDPQLWVPVVVLAAGLVVLAWVHG